MFGWYEDSTTCYLFCCLLLAAAVQAPNLGVCTPQVIRVSAVPGLPHFQGAGMLLPLSQSPTSSTYCQIPSRTATEC